MTPSTPSTLRNTDVARAVKDGLLKKPKNLPSWLYYDKAGDILFQQIMLLTEYYPTRCELEILRNRKEDIFQFLKGQRTPFQVVELGAGNGVKTAILLHCFSKHSLPFTYIPVDISQNVLDQLVERLYEDMPDLNIQPQKALYHDAFDNIGTEESMRKMILFLGGNIGNFAWEDACEFMKKLAVNVGPEDYLLIGFDLRKDPIQIQAAYSDRKGVTQAFNMNLLHRFNRELGAQFITAQFDYYSSYDPSAGTVNNYLISKQEQDVLIPALGIAVHFDKWETIHTEISQKYDMSMIEKLVTQAGLKVADVFYDEKQYFCNALIQS